MNLGEKLKQRKPREKTVELDGDKFLVRFPGRSQKNQIFAMSQVNDKLDTDLLECNLLAVCVLDPSTFEQVLPNAADWKSLASDVSQLVSAVIEVCGLDRSETKAMGKDSSESLS